MEHLKDLRKLLLFSLGVIVVCFLIIFSFYSKQLVQWISQPILERNIEIIYTAVSEAFTAQLKLSFIAGTVLASPLIFFALWRFIRPALYKEERLAFSALMIAGLFLFVLGVIFAYVMVFNLAVNFFIVSGEEVATPMFSLAEYVSFLFSFLLPFGVMFETPIVVVALSRLGIIDAKTLSKGRRFIVFGVFIIAAVLTPPDVVSQTLLALPLLVLFEISILLARLVRPRKKEEKA
ncbi:MAG: twin-arginine translocase subunit TatC [Lachnospiraceae bacterium]